MIILMMVDTPEQKRKFAELYERYRYLMFKIALDILHEHHLAEDALQEAFVRVAKHMECIGQLEETATKRYLITITKNAALAEQGTSMEQTEYSFLDWGREFGGIDEDIRVVTKDKSIFQKYMQTYTDGKPGMPFFFELDGNKVVRILEKPMA